MPLLGDKGSLRDALLFAALGLLPAGALTAVGLRAVANEDAAVRREAVQVVDAAARKLERDVASGLDGAGEALAAVPYEDVPENEATLRGVLRAKLPAPAAADFVAMGFAGAKPAELPGASADECKAMGRAALSGGKPDETFFDRCAASRDAAGRWVFPVFAAAPPSAPWAHRLGEWMAARGALLTTPERTALADDVRGISDPARRSLAEKALDAAVSSGSSPEARRAADVGARRWPDARGISEWSENGTRGVLRAVDRQRTFGFVVHRASLEAALQKGGHLPRDVAWSFDESRAGPIRATAVIAPGLGVVLYPARTDLVDARSRQKRWIVASMLGGATIVVLALGVLVALRVRQMRRTSELRTDFVAAVSHELRTPIGSIRMLAELLEEGRVEEDERREVHEALAREARRLSDTVERLLQLRRMLAGKRDADLQLADVSLVVEDAIDALEDRHPDMERVERSLEAVESRVDRGLLRLAVDNLLGNARKYAPDGTPYEVRVAREGDRVVIEVQDHGPGIAPRDRARVFAPFERADDRLSRATEGFGIGLALVRWVAEVHGGEVGLRSEPGKGACFSISFPLRTEGESGE